jgi:hypothetical protein
MSENGFERDETSSTRFKKAASQWWLEQNINGSATSREITQSYNGMPY